MKLSRTGSKNKIRYKDTDSDLDVDLSYISNRIIAMGFPSVSGESFFRNPREEVQRFFATKHRDRYRIYNLCREKEYSLSDVFPEGVSGSRLKKYAFDKGNPCPFSMLVAFCEDCNRFLSLHPANVVAVHCKSGKGRTGLMISSYFVHSGLDAEEALVLYAQKRTKDHAGVVIPSQRR